MSVIFRDPEEQVVKTVIQDGVQIGVIVKTTKGFTYKEDEPSEDCAPVENVTKITMCKQQVLSAIDYKANRKRAKALAALNQ